jgi:hypothetical protein
MTESQVCYEGVEAMFFSTKLIEELVLEVSHLSELEIEGLHNLIYHLNLPGKGVSCCIAEVIADTPSISRYSSHFPSRLAFGVLDDALIRLDQSARYSHQKRLCRKVSDISLALQKLEQSVNVIDRFRDNLALLVFASAAIDSLKSADREVSNVERSTLVESILEAHLAEAELTKKLLERMAGLFRREEKNLLKERVTKTLEEGLENPPWDDTLGLQPLFDLNQPVHFRLSLIERSQFSESARQTLECVNEVCRH